MPIAIDPSHNRTRLGDLFGIDLRSLAAMRIGLGLIILADLANRLPNLTAHYTDQGVLPRWALLERFANSYNISIHLISGMAWVQAILFVVAGLFAACMIAGYRTRLMAALSWYMLISLHARNGMILDAGDVLFRMLLFWSMFLPTEARWSLDAAMGKIQPGPNQMLSVASFALLLQLAMVYLFSALFKTDPVWHDGTAIFYALQINQFATPLGHWMLQFPHLLRVASFGIWWLELLGPIVVFLPIFTWRIRVIAVATFWLLHAGMGLGLELGHFPYICGMAWLAYLPGEFWELAKVSRLLASMHRRLHSIARRLRPRIEQLYVFWPVRSSPASPSLLNHMIALFFLVYVILWNLRGYDPQNYGRYFPHQLEWVTGLTWVDQKWNMFSPRPMSDDGWYVIPGKMLNGQEVDLFTGGKPVSWDRPPCVSTTFPDTRWRKYMLNLWSADNSAHRLWYARYLTRCWNDTHEGGEQMESFEIDFMLQPTTADGVRQPPDKRVLWQHNCFR